MVKDFTAGFRVEKEIYEEFLKKCEQHNLPPSLVVRLFVIAFNEGRIDLTDIIKEGR